MTIQKVCDVCKSVNNWCNYKITKKWKLLEFCEDSNGGCWSKLDICDKCFRMIQDIVKRENKK